nr:immunoglobulin light chain junction region [Macaca mulatta]
YYYCSSYASTYTMF